MAGASRNQKASKATQKCMKRAKEKQQHPASSCSDRSTRCRTSTSEVVVEKMSPAKQTISMFEGLANQFILDVKPFAKSTEAPESTAVLKSVLAPDVSGIPEPAEGEVEDLVSKQIEKLARMVAEMDVCEEMLCEDNCSTKPGAANEAALENMEEDKKEDVTEVTVEDIKAKIIEILNVPFPCESHEETSQKDIDRAHDENMRRLKKKLRLDFEGDGAAQSAPVANIQEKIGQFEVEISKHYKGRVREASMQKVPCTRACALQKPEMDDAKKIFSPARPRVSKRRKSLIQCNVNDLTGSSVFNVNFEPHTPHLEGECPTLASEQDMALEDYNTERELIEMARKEEETQCESRVKVVYVENGQAGKVFGLGSIFSRLFSCGTFI